MWTPIKGREISSAFRGITTPIRDILNEINNRGWEAGNITFTAGAYKAVAKNPHGESLEATGITDATAAGNLLLKIMRRETGREGPRAKLAQWQTDWSNNLEEIAKAYAKAPIYDPKAAPAWKALADDSTRRAEVLQQQLKVEVVPDPEPYSTAQEMIEDIHKNKHFLVSGANSQHPMWSTQQNIAFRIVHDVLGHAVSGGDFGWQGENAACRAHFPLLTPLAQKALFTECFAPETLVRTEGGYRPIHAIQIGERVLSSDGRYHAVEAVHRKHYKGELCELNGKSLVEPIRVTPEHALLSVVATTCDYKQACSPGTCGRFVKNGHALEWLDADQVEYVAITIPIEKIARPSVEVPAQYHGKRPVARKGPFSFKLTDDFLWCVGLYLAEGSSGFGRISFGLHQSEAAYAQRLKNTFESLGYTVSQRIQSGLGLEVTINSSTLAEWFPNWLGRGSSNKSIPPEILNLPDDQLEPLIQGVMDGDGFRKRNFLGQTSKQLALQMAELSLRGGSLPSLRSSQRPNRQRVYGLEAASATYDTPIRRGRRGYWSINGKTVVKIIQKKVPYSGPVYDLTVEGDHTYVVQNLTVHNCIAQTAAGAYFRSFMPQKVAYIDEYIEPAQQQENPQGHQGVHPSQSVAPAMAPQVQPSTPQGLSWATQTPHEDFSGGLPVFGSVDSPEDPNARWEAQVEPMTDPTTGAPSSAYLHHGDPLQADAVRENAMKVNTGWEKLKNGDGSPDIDSMRQAIINAFRVVLLSPRKNLRSNAIHYQDLDAVPATVTDPKRYWDTLEAKRESWNQARGYAPGSHKIYWKEQIQFRQYVRAANPDLDEWEADEKADREFYNMLAEEEDRLMNDPANEKKGADEIGRKAEKEIQRRLKTILKPSTTTDHGHEQLFLANRETMRSMQTDETPIDSEQKHFATQLDLKGQEAGKYPAFFGTHLKSIAQIGQHVDELLNAALEDIKDHDGSGHHFRATTLSLQLPGVGPKVASFAWLFLAPSTSQLATIDTHMMSVLGHPYSEMNNRDYFKYERELAAGRNAAGYEHVPLGQFQWGMWDHKRTGPGTHQDHSALKALDPTPYNQVNWAQTVPISKGEDVWEAPDWWAQTQPARDAVGQDWDQNIATQFGKGVTPRFADYKSKLKKRSASNRIPWILWGEKVWIGIPGETFMNLARRQLNYTMEDVWERLPEAQFSAGSYDPLAQRVFPQDQISDRQREWLLRKLMHPPM